MPGISGVQTAGGAFDWFVTKVRVLERENKGPLLTQTVPESGTDLPTVYQSDFAVVRQRFLALSPDFAWPRFTERARHIFLELQAAWSDRRWERARPYVSDQMFQTQLYWITEYQRQQLRMNSRTVIRCPPAVNRRIIAENRES